MWRSILLGCAVCAAMALPGLAQDDAPPAPQPRPEGLTDDQASPDEAVEDAAPVEDDDAAAEDAAPTEDDDASGADLRQEDEADDTAPDRIYQAACPAILSGAVVGELVAPLEDPDCPLQSPFEITALRLPAGEVALPSGPVVGCAMATEMHAWAGAVDAYARGALGMGLAMLETGPGHVCRTRYDAEDAPISEHAFGNAMDVSAIGLEDETRITVLDDWSLAPLAPEAKLLAFAHGAACALFTTVLGPEANSAHADHFHFDLGCHGQSCTARICN